MDEKYPQQLAPHHWYMLHCITALYTLLTHQSVYIFYYANIDKKTKMYDVHGYSNIQFEGNPPVKEPLKSLITA